MGDQYTKRELLRDGTGKVVGTVTILSVAGCSSMTSDVSASASATVVQDGGGKKARANVTVNNTLDTTITALVDVTFEWSTSTRMDSFETRVPANGDTRRTLYSHGTEDMEFNGVSASATRV